MNPHEPYQSPNMRQSRSRRTVAPPIQPSERSPIFSLPDRFGKWPALVLTGLSLAIAATLVDVHPEQVASSAARGDRCQIIVEAQATLSREELVALLSIPERESMSQIRSVVSSPYCKLPDLELRVGAIAHREAYPLEFDPDTWLVILYEGDEYAGYDFSFHR